MNNLEVDNLLYYKNWMDFLTSLNTKMIEINDSLYRNYPNAYISTNHHVLIDNEREIFLDRYETTSGKSQLSSEEFWQIIQSQMKELKENSTGGKSEMDELQRLLKLFNDFINSITSKFEDDATFDVILQTGNLRQFSLYFIQFLKNKIQSTDDFIGECLNNHYNSIKALESLMLSDMFPENESQIEQFFEIINTYKSLQELTDQWIDYQVN